LDSTVLRWPSSLLIVLWGKEAASQQRGRRRARGGRPAADQERYEFGCRCLLLLDSCFADSCAVAKNGCL
jgi:hypothetical protein